MFIWTAVSRVNLHSRNMGSLSFSPHMQEAIRDTQINSPHLFVSKKVHVPLESNQEDILSNPRNRLRAQVSSYHADIDEPHAVIDTGCQRSAIGRSTLDYIQSCLPNDLKIKIRSTAISICRHWWRDSYQGGSTFASLFWPQTRYDPCCSP